MKTFGIDCELNYESAEAATYVFNIAARDDARQRLREENVLLMPPRPHEEFSDGYGNRFFRVSTAGGPLSIRYVAEVEVRPFATSQAGAPLNPALLPPETLPFLLPSRYCESDRLFGLASGLFSGHASQAECVEAICAWIRGNIRYRIGTSLAHGSAWDVLQTGTGVCRDFAHLAVALCRAMNIPARFVTSHARWHEPPPDFHALIECYADGQWRLFDPTAMAPIDDVICIGKGLDATQVPFCTIFGAYRMTRMSPLVHELGQPGRAAGEAPSLPPVEMAA